MAYRRRVMEAVLRKLAPNAVLRYEHGKMKLGASWESNVSEETEVVAFIEKNLGGGFDRSLGSRAWIGWFPYRMIQLNFPLSNVHFLSVEMGNSRKDRVSGVSQ